MRFVAALAIVVLALAGAAAIPLDARAVRAADDKMCTAPHDDTSKWAPASLQALSVKLPSAYKLSGTSAGQASVYRAGSRVIGIQIGDAGVRVPESFYLSAAATSGGGNQNVSLGMAGSAGSASYEHTMASTCEAVIAARPATITTWTWASHAGAMSNSSDEGKHYLAIVRWSGMNGQPTSYLWISSTYKSDLMSLRQIFWTAHFEGFASGAEGATSPLSLANAPCRDTMPAPRGTISDFLDTALVVMLLNGISPALPRGANEIVVTFDSSGAPARVLVTSSSMPDSDQARLGSIVGSNVNPQPAGSVTLARLRVGLGFTGTSVQLAGSGRCAYTP